jgi:HD-like signal output (HDOD) protein
MLNRFLLVKLESLQQLPMLPSTAAEALQLIDNPRTSAGMLGRIIERDQALAARVLKIANSPFYGFPREISTIDLASVVLGFDAIKETILSLVIQGVFAHTRSPHLDIQDFWKYSIFCGSAARFLARRLGYRVAGEAFVAGLMHDIGVLIIAQFFPRELDAIRQEQSLRGLSLVEAEHKVLAATHCEIGAWLAERWNLPQQLINAIALHHITPLNAAQTIAPAQTTGAETTAGDTEPLTSIVALTEWFAGHLGFKQWAREIQPSALNIPAEVTDKIGAHDILDPGSAIEALKPALMEEYERSAILRDAV